MRKSKIVSFLFFLSLGSFLVFAAALLIRLAEQRRGEEFYIRLAETGQQMPADSVSPVPSGTFADGCGEGTKQECETALPKLHALSRRCSQVAKEYPDVVFWLQIPDTSLDYPVMLGTDNQFYLNHLPDGNKNVLGSLFLDYRTAKEGVHLIIYGHNRTDGTMFGLLEQYESQEYFQEHRTLRMATPDAVYVCPIFSVRCVGADSDAYRLEWEDDRGLAEHIRQAAAESLYQIEVDAEAAIGVLTLSTCTSRGDQRFLVQAVITE